MHMCARFEPVRSELQSSVTEGSAHLGCDTALLGQWFRSYGGTYCLYLKDQAVQEEHELLDPEYKGTMTL
jgi:hypothetical protein